MSDNVSPTAVSTAIRGEQAEYGILWDDEMKSVNRYVHHKRIVVLMVYWENDPDLKWTDMRTEGEVNRLASVLGNEYHYQVMKKVIPRDTRHVQQLMDYYLAKFVKKFDGKDEALLIIYYAGHAWVETGKRGVLTMAGITTPQMSSEDINRRNFRWNKSESIIQDTDADVLVILDCCESGTLRFPPRSRGQRLFEVLTACDADETTRFPGQYSFTSALIYAFEGLVKEKRFSTCKLKQKIMEAPDFPPKQHPMLHPRPFSMTGTTNDDHITLEILGEPENEDQDSLGISREEMKIGGDYVDLRFRFTTTVGKKEITDLANSMKRLHQSGELSLGRIGFVRKGNLATLIQAAGAAFLAPVRDKGLSTRRKLSTCRNCQNHGIGYHLTGVAKSIWYPFSKLLRMAFRADSGTKSEDP